MLRKENSRHFITAADAVEGVAAEATATAANVAIAAMIAATRRIPTAIRAVEAAKNNHNHTIH